MQDVFQQFLSGLKQTGLLEFIAVFAGIASVWFSKKENILVYPVGLLNTIIYIYLSLKYDLLGEASVNLYYTVVSIYGWILWTRKDSQLRPVLNISHSTKKEWIQQLVFFAGFYLLIFFALSYLKQYFAGAIPWADAFASATAYTGMWLMTRKKVESWWWWIATNAASIPLYFYKRLTFTSVYYIVLLVMAVAGLMEWKKRNKAVQNAAAFTVEHQ
jgi:nicotinamide mononucleotide transporter